MIGHLRNGGTWNASEDTYSRIDAVYYLAEYTIRVPIFVRVLQGPVRFLQDILYSVRVYEYTFDVYMFHMFLVYVSLWARFRAICSDELALTDTHYSSVVTGIGSQQEEGTHLLGMIQCIISPPPLSFSLYTVRNPLKNCNPGAEIAHPYYGCIAAALFLFCILVRVP